MLFRTNTKKKCKIGEFCILLFLWVGVGVSNSDIFSLTWEIPAPGIYIIKNQWQLTESEKSIFATNSSKHYLSILS